MIYDLHQPWPYYVAGHLLGLAVLVLLLLGNKQFGISANLRHISAACFSAGLNFFSTTGRKGAGIFPLS